MLHVNGDAPIHQGRYNSIFSKIGEVGVRSESASGRDDRGPSLTRPANQLNLQNSRIGAR